MYMNCTELLLTVALSISSTIGADDEVSSVGIVLLGNGSVVQVMLSA